MSSTGSVNKVILVGRLGKDPDIRYTTEGTPVANFSVATDEAFTDRAGDKQARTEWHRVVAWKRWQVYIEGSLRSRKWQDREGGERTSFEVVATRMVMLGSKAGKQTASNGTHGNAHATAKSASEAETGADDVPF